MFCVIPAKAGIQRHLKRQICAMVERKSSISTSDYLNDFGITEEYENDCHEENGGIVLCHSREGGDSYGAKMR